MISYTNFIEFFCFLVGGVVVVSASDLGPGGQEFEPWPVHPRSVLRQNS